MDTVEKLNYLKIGGKMKQQYTTNYLETREALKSELFMTRTLHQTTVSRWGIFCFIASFAMLLLVATSQVSGQGQANIWYFGSKAGINFNTVPATILTNGSLDAENVEGEGYASISDENGNLLFYTDGVTVFNRNHVAMPNGTGLRGHLSAAQSAIIVPSPAASHLYYVFTVSENKPANPVATDGVHYNIVDMSAAGGLGNVTTKNQAVWAGVHTMESLCAVPHSNGTDYWVIVHGSGGSNQFRAYPVTAGGVGAAVVSSVGYTVPLVTSPGIDANSQGMIKANSCYTKIAASYFAQDGPGADKAVEVLDFDWTTGQVSNPVRINNFQSATGAYGLEFSPNGRYLYVTELMRNRLVRFDLDAPNINTSRMHIGWGVNGENTGETGAPRLGQVQLAPDGNLYVANFTTWTSTWSDNSYISRVSNPDAATPTFTQMALAYPGSGGTVKVSHGLPTFLKSLVANTLSFGQGMMTLGDDLYACAGQPINFSYVFTGVRMSVLWNFGDGTTSTLDAPTHTYNPATVPQTYTVILQITDNCGRVVEQRRDIIINAANPTGVISCSGNVMNLSSPDANAANYKWWDAAVGGTVLGTGASVNLDYTGNLAAAPASVWVEDATSFNNTYGPFGNVPGVAEGNMPNTSTSFQLKKALMLTSLQVQLYTWGGCNTNVTLRIRQGGVDVPGSIQTINVTNCGSPVQFTPNVRLNPGTYTIELTSSVSTVYFRRFASGGGTTVNNDEVTFAQPQNTFAGALRFAEYNPCGGRVQVDRNCLLPIRLVHFSGKPQGNQVLLHWITSQEINNSHYLIQRSTDGTNYETIGRVDGLGNVNQLSDYLFADAMPAQGKNYYRLVQYDYDGAYSIAGYTLVIHGSNELDMVVYPNPFAAYTNVLVSSEEETVAVTILDLNGKTVYENTSFPTNENVELGQHLASGVYFVQAVGHTQRKVFKLVKE
jgi:hypothetical protein